MKATSLDNGRRSPVKLLRAVAARLLGRNLLVICPLFQQVLLDDQDDFEAFISRENDRLFRSPQLMARRDHP